MIEVVFETHSTSEDNEAGIATGWLPGQLSTVGRQQASALGRRRREDGIAAVFASDLQRAVETARIAFDGSSMPILLDWRLRECDYGALNGAPADRIHDERRRRLREPYPGGESWRQATDRIGSFLSDPPNRWAGQRILVIGHVATRWGLDRFLDGRDLDQLVGEEFSWREGWEYVLPD